MTPRAERFTPADFALTAQRAAQLTFKRALSGGSAELNTDCPSAIAATRASVNPDVARDFELEESVYARL